MQARLARVLNLRPGEGRGAAICVAVAFSASTGLMIGGSGIEALFFARYGVSRLPVMYLLLGGAMFLTSLLIAFVFGWVGRGGTSLLIPGCLAIFAVLGRIGIAAHATWVTQALWILQGAAQFLVAWAVWGLAGLVTDTRQAKRIFPLVGAGSVLGYVIGGVITQPLASAIGAANLILVWAGSLGLVVALGVRLVSVGAAGRSPAASASRPTPLRSLAGDLRRVLRSPLLRWMALAAVLFSLLFFSLYLPFSKAATDRYTNPDDLAGFFGVFFGTATGVAFLISAVVTPRLLTRFGVPAVMLVLPLIYVVAFATLSLRSTFLTLAAFRFAQVAWMQGAAVSAWEAMVNAVPAERRDRTRAVLYGGPTQVGTVLAGLVALLGGHSASATMLSLIGLGGGLLATWAILGVRRAYPRALIEALREGRPTVFEAPASMSVPVGGMTVDRSAGAAAIAALGDGDARVRRVAAHVLRHIDTPDAIDALGRAVGDHDADVRATALDSLARLDGADARWDRSAARRLIRDPAAPVRARAAAVVLAEDPDDDAVDVLLALANDGDADVRIEAVQAMRGIPDARVIGAARAALRDPAPAVRAAAARVVAEADPRGPLEPLIDALGDENPEVVSAAASAVAGLGEQAVAPVVAALDVPARREGALSALTTLPMSNGSAAAVRAFAGTCVRLAVDRARSASALEGDDDRTRLLRDSVSASSRSAAALALRAAGVLGERRAMAIALDSLSTTDPTQRANAIEVIERVGASEVVRPLLAMWDAADAGSVGRADVLERLRHADDEWIRACVKLIDDATNEGGPVTRTLDTLSTMERVLFLRKVPLFAALPPEDLQPIAAIATEHAFSGGDVFANQGEPGDVMHIIVSGDVSVVDTADDGRVVAVRSPGDVVGEMAVITSEPRIATLVASSDVRVLSIDRRRFEAILRERPETSLGVIRVLCHRLTELQTPTARPGGDGGAVPPAAVSPS